MPEALVAHARRFVESGAAPATPRRAATVVLLRPAPTGAFDVYAMRRAATMRFAPNMYAFPGGAVDERDAATGLDWRGPAPAEWAARLGLPEADARAVVCAAVREVFEETGVLLAGDGATAPDEADRLELESGRTGLAELLAVRGLPLRSDLLAPWARWLTPEFEPRRYDTYFFLARLPEGQQTRSAGPEAAHTAWLSPAEAARLPMLPPTAYTLRQLCEYQDIESALAAAEDRWLTAAVTPHLVDDPDRPRLAIYPQ